MYAIDIRGMQCKLRFFYFRLAVKYNTRRTCKFDNTKKYFGPPDYRILNLLRDKNIYLGW